ncbi:MAG: N6-adenosine-specific RNA methylase IME4, partial [Chlamydiales bacterium]
DKESQDRRNKNRVNAQLAGIAGISTAKVFRYKEILEHGIPEEVAAVESGKAKICPTYDKMLERHRIEASFSEFPKEKYRVVYADLYERDLDSGLGWTPKRKTIDIRNIPMKGFLELEAVCFLWSPPNYLMETLKIMKLWGFEYSTAFVLENEPFRELHNSMDHIFVLVGEKGGCKPDIKERFSSILDKHKYSTDRVMKFRHLIDGMYKEGNKIEFFPERQALGWDKYQEQDNI